VHATAAADRYISALMLTLLILNLHPPLEHQVCEDFERFF